MTILFLLIMFSYLCLTFLYLASNSLEAINTFNDEVSTSKGTTTFIPYTKEYMVASIEVLAI